MSFEPKVHMSDGVNGGDSLVVESGGSVNVKSGGSIGRVCGATFTIGDEAANSINVGIQLTDAAGSDLDERCTVLAYLSDDANGDSVAATAPDGNVAVGTDGVLIPVVADKAFYLTSEADGDIDLDVGETGTDTWYLIVVLPDGTLVASDAITFA